MNRIGVFIAIFTLIGCQVFSNDVGICLEGPLNIRQNHQLSSNILGEISIYEKVLILQKSRNKEEIDGLADSWYLVKNAQGLEGWVFGGYLYIMKNDTGVESNVLITTKSITSIDLDFVIDRCMEAEEFHNYFVGKKFISSTFRSTPGFASNLLKKNGSYDYVETSFEYRDHLILLLYRKSNNDILDMVVIQKPNDQSYLTSGPVQINQDNFDWNVRVLITGPYKNGINTNIEAAFKSDLAIERIEKIEYQSIRIFSEE